MAAETAFRSEERFDQRTFRRWLDARPRSDVNHYELLDGRIVMTPPAGWPHASIEVAISARLNEYVRANKLGMVLGSSAGYDLPSGDTLEPDVSFISAERFDAGPKPATGRFVRIVPNLVVEILSKATARYDRTEKKKTYERNGVDEYWIVDPGRREVTVYHLRKGGYATGRKFSTGTIRSRAVRGFSVEVDEIVA